MTATVTNLAAKRQPINADTSADGTRYYIHPQTGERFLSVTTALKVINKEALVHWAAKVVAEEAMDQLPTLIKASRVRPCGERSEDHRCHKCRDCAITDLRGRPAAVRDKAADLGSRVHTAAEEWALTGNAGPDDDEIAPFVAQFLAFCAQFKPTYDASEMTVISREHGYAGTLDGIVRLGWCPPKHLDLVGKPGVMDLKTGKGVYSEFALQLAPYKFAETVLLPDGSEVPMPETMDTAYVLHVRPDGYQVHPVEINLGDFGAFLSTFALYRWSIERAPTVIGRAMYKPPLGAKPAEDKPKVARPRKSTSVKVNTPAPARSRTAAEAIGARTFPGSTAGNTLTDDSIPF